MLLQVKEQLFIFDSEYDLIGLSVNFILYYSIKEQHFANMVRATAQK